MGTSCYEFERVPEALTDLFRDEAFCSVGCVRAFLLEAMEVLEGLASPNLLSDVQSVYSHLRAMFALIQETPRAPAAPVIAV